MERLDMQQPDIHLLLHPYFDGELDFSDALVFEEHLPDCSRCLQGLEEQKKIRAILEQSPLRHRAPKKLKQTLRSSFGRDDELRGVIFSWNWKIYGIAATIAIMALALWVFIPKESNDHDLSETNELVSAHVRSLMAAHLFDIASSDQHTVKPWFAGKLNFSPAVTDLSAQGFQLIGGRLDYIGGEPVAVLVYQHGKHIINVFEGMGQPDKLETRIVKNSQGFNLIIDRNKDIKLWLVSDLNAAELGHLADLLKR
jgi:anti-sigma factor RsiW